MESTHRCNPTGPFHLGAWTDNLKYEAKHPRSISMVGGVLAITKAQYLAVNGFSNRYWGWGGEDDDFGYRWIPRLGGEFILW
jgi:hypothetical protein